MATQTEASSFLTGAPPPGAPGEPNSEGGVPEDHKGATGTEGGQKPDETKPDSGSAANANEPPADIEVKFPEGYEASPELVSTIKEVAKAKQLTAEEAGKLATSIAASHEKFIQSIMEKDKQTKQGWIEEIKSDKDFGGAKLKESFETASKAMKRYGSAGLNKFFSETGLGSHPELVKFVIRVGRDIKEDTIATRTASQSSPASPEEKQVRVHEELYPSMFEKKE
jgi:hypothetical protein